jgi:hypothetical protein
MIRDHPPCADCDPNPTRSGHHLSRADETCSNLVARADIRLANNRWSHAMMRNDPIKPASPGANGAATSMPKTGPNSVRHNEFADPNGLVTGGQRKFLACSNPPCDDAGPCSPGKDAPPRLWMPIARICSRPGPDITRLFGNFRLISFSIFAILPNVAMTPIVRYSSKMRWPTRTYTWAPRLR